MEKRMTPKRLQRKRTKGWRKPPGSIICDRTSRWGNPFKVGDRSPHDVNVIIDSQHAIDLFEQMLESMQEAGTLKDYLEPLRGRDLLCFCGLDKPCHVDVLLKWANR